MTRPMLTAVLLLALAGCGGETGSGDASPSTPMPSNGGGVTQAMLDGLVDQASEETGVPVDEIEVLAAEAVTWPDGSLGCPEEGMGYTQALVPGFRVMLEIGGERIQYHAGTDAEFFACDDPSEPVDDGAADR